jgi:hypothetical protein
MAVLTGANGSLTFGGNKIGCVQNWSLNIDKQALDVTCLGERDRKYVPGLRGATGSANVFYDTADAPTAALFNNVLANFDDVTTEVVFVLSTAGSKQLTAKALLTSVGASVSVGEAQVHSVGFQISEAITGSF